MGARSCISWQEAALVIPYFELQEPEQLKAILDTDDNEEVSKSTSDVDIEEEQDLEALEVPEPPSTVPMCQTRSITAQFVRPKHEAKVPEQLGMATSFLAATAMDYVKEPDG